MRLALFAVVALYGLSSCTDGKGGIRLPSSYPSGAAITPAHFRFATISAPDDDGGGWREVCIHARISQDLRGKEIARHVCRVGVGVPIQQFDGTYISLRDAQMHAANAANTAAYQNLTGTIGLAEATCRAIKRDMERLLREHVGGARVHGCRSVIGGIPVPVVSFP